MRFLAMIKLIVIFSAFMSLTSFAQWNEGDDSPGISAESSSSVSPEEVTQLSSPAEDDDEDEDEGDDF